MSENFSNIIDHALWQIISGNNEEKNSQNQSFCLFLTKEAIKKIFSQNVVRK